MQLLLFKVSYAHDKMTRNRVRRPFLAAAAFCSLVASAVLGVLAVMVALALANNLIGRPW